MNPAKDFDLFITDEPFLQLLKPSWRAALELAVLENKSYEDISAIEQIPIGTVKSRLNRARAKIIQLRLAAASPSDATTEGHSDANV